MFLKKWFWSDVQLLSKFHIGVGGFCWEMTKSEPLAGGTKQFSFAGNHVKPCHFWGPHFTTTYGFIAVFPADRFNTVCVPVGGNVTVPCPNSSAEDIKFSLFKDGECVHHHTRISVATTPNQNTSTNLVGVEYPNANSLNFTITGVNASSHGIYRCEVTAMFPPPLITFYSDLGILVLIEGKYFSVILCTYCIFKLT